MGVGSRLIAVVPLSGGSSHRKEKMGWLTGTNWMQKNTFFKSKYEKQVASVGIRANKLYGFGTSRCNVTVA